MAAAVHPFARMVFIICVASLNTHARQLSLRRANRSVPGVCAPSATTIEGATWRPAPLSRVPLLQNLRGGSEDESSSPPPPPPIDQNDGHIEVETGPRDFDDEVEDVEQPPELKGEHFEVATPRPGTTRTFDLTKPFVQHAQARFHALAINASKLVTDGGLCMETIRMGSGTRMPRAGDFVYIHYRAFVMNDGRQFDDSRHSEQRNGMPFGFTMGRAQVIQAWEIALASMTVGQVALVYARNAYLHSTDGMRLKGLQPYTAMNHHLAVPEQADVSFELELLEFGNGRALTRDGRVRLHLHHRGLEGTHLTCFARTKVQALTAEENQGVYNAHPNMTAADQVLIRYTASFNGTQLASTRACGVHVRLGTQLTCFTGNKVQILTQLGEQAAANCRRGSSSLCTRTWV